MMKIGDKVEVSFTAVLSKIEEGWVDGKENQLRYTLKHRLPGMNTHEFTVVNKDMIIKVDSDG